MMQKQEKYAAIPYPLDEFMQQWQDRKLSPEQAIDQLLIWVQIQQEALQRCEQHLAEQEEYMADLVALMVEGRMKRKKGNGG